MKKLLSLVLVLSMALCFIGCGKKTETTYVTNMNGAEVKLTLYATGDVIKRIVQTSSISLDGLSDDDVKMVEEAIEELKGTYNAIDGVTYTSNTTDNSLTETFDMDISKKKTLKALIENNLLPVSNKDADYLSLKATKEGLESNGYTESK